MCPISAICRQPTTKNPGLRRSSHRNTKTYRPLPTILIEPLGRLFKISNNNCTECGRNPRYGYSGSPYEGDSHTILARDGEASHLCSTINCMFRNLGSNIPIKALTKGMSWRESLLDAVQLEETLGIAGVTNLQVSVLWGSVKHIRQEPREISLLRSSGRSKVRSDVQQVVSQSGLLPRHCHYILLWVTRQRGKEGDTRQDLSVANSSHK